MKPFLRWAGGKTRSISFLKSHMPKNFYSIKDYYEPFLGAGSLFFELCPSQAILSDLNNDLIECYKAIKEKPNLVSRYLNKHYRESSKSYYYRMRYKYNNSKSSVSKAALFIYLNKTCFNGIWRVNNNGMFNVPYGYKEPPYLLNRNDIIKISNALSKAKLYNLDFKEAVKNANKGDFIYFDPPYPPLNNTSNFTHYTKERFSIRDHERVAEAANELSKRGCSVMISNSSTDFVYSLYKKNFNIHELELRRWIRTDGKRYKIKEVVITNY